MNVIDGWSCQHPNIMQNNTPNICASMDFSRQTVSLSHSVTSNRKKYHKYFCHFHSLISVILFCTLILVDRKRDKSTRTRYNCKILLRWARKGTSANGGIADGPSYQLSYPQRYAVSQLKAAHGCYQHCMLRRAGRPNEISSKHQQHHADKLIILLFTRMENCPKNDICTPAATFNVVHNHMAYSRLNICFVCTSALR